MRKYIYKKNKNITTKNYVLKKQGRKQYNRVDNKKNCKSPSMTLSKQTMNKRKKKQTKNKKNLKMFDSLT